MAPTSGTPGRKGISQLDFREAGPVLALLYRGENWPEGEASTHTANMERLQAVSAQLSRPATTKPAPHFGRQNYIVG